MTQCDFKTDKPFPIPYELDQEFIEREQKRKELLEAVNEAKGSLEAACSMEYVAKSPTFALPSYLVHKRKPA